MVPAKVSSSEEDDVVGSEVLGVLWNFRLCSMRVLESGWLGDRVGGM